MIIDENEPVQRTLKNLSDESDETQERKKLFFWNKFVLKLNLKNVYYYAQTC